MTKQNSCSIDTDDKTFPAKVSLALQTELRNSQLLKYLPQGKV